MNVGSIVFEPAPVFMKPVDHSCWFFDGKSPPVYVHAREPTPMQLYCYVKQLDDVRAFMRRLDISKHVYPLRDAAEMERLALHGQVFVHFPDHVEHAPYALASQAIVEGMHVMEIHVGEGHS